MMTFSLHINYTIIIHIGMKYISIEVMCACIIIFKPDKMHNLADKLYYCQEGEFRNAMKQAKL